MIITIMILFSTHIHPPIHPLEIQEKIMLETCRSELCTKVHSKLSHHYYYCMNQHGQRTLCISAANSNLEVVHPQFEEKVTCMHNSPE